MLNERDANVLSVSSSSGRNYCVLLQLSSGAVTIVTDCFNRASIELLWVSADGQVLLQGEDFALIWFGMKTGIQRSHRGQI